MGLPFQGIAADRCFICGGTDGLHSHHVIPEAYGGSDGPQVPLCGTHHTLIHSIALQRELRCSDPDLTRRQRILYLATCIARARQRWKSQNRISPLQMNATFPAEIRAKVEILQGLTGLSQRSLVEFAINFTFKHLTVTRKNGNS